MTPIDRIITRLDASPSVADQVLAERLRHQALMWRDWGRVVDEGEKLESEGSNGR